MKNVYEKPQINVVDFKVNNAVADTCWGLTPTHTQQATRYYDVTGEGIVSFNVAHKSGNCGAPDSYNLVYIYYNEAGELINDAAAGAAFKSEVDSALSSKGGNNGQPYSGIDADFPTQPVPDSK